MSLLVLAFPVFASKDFEWIETLREKNDELNYGIVAPHFTIVFPVDEKTESEFSKEVIERAVHFRPFEFELKNAIVHKDYLSEYYYEFLVPDKGYDQIVALHDQLYNGSLMAQWRRDIPYVPHITVGNSKDRLTCERNIAELASQGITIPGRIESLSILNYSNRSMRCLKSIWLK